MRILLGTLTHVPLIVFWMSLYTFLSGFDSSSTTTADLYFAMLRGQVRPFVQFLSIHSIAVNVFVIICNIVFPAYPLNGSRCLTAFVVDCGFSSVQAAVIAAATAIVEAVGVVIFGIYAVMAMEGGRAGVLYVPAGIFMFTSSFHLLQMALAGRVYEHPLFERPCYRQLDNEQSKGRNQVDLTPLTSPSDLNSILA
jgi:hypothetical protein